MDEQILIVDDDALILSGFKKLLQKQGYGVVTSESGEDALKQLKNNNFDLVLTDIVLPGINGLDVLAAVKKLSPNTLMMMITGFASMETAVKALRLGAVDYIIKPCDGEELKIRLDNAFEKKRLYNELVRKDTQLVMHDLTRGLADILNNRMTAVQGFVEFGISCLKSGDFAEGLDSFLRSQESIMRVNEITSKLLQYTYRPEYEQTFETDISQLLKKYESEFSTLTFTYAGEENLPLIWLTRNTKEAFVEIFKNSLEAGSDTIKISYHKDKKNRKFIIRISDNGKGIDPKEISKVFIPFYKTKATAHTGLGLWKVYQAVTSNKGEIDIESRPNKGTTVTLTFPLKED